MNVPKSVTIHDVAKRAGVSLSTVSRVLNDYDSVNPQTREKVEAAISDLNYEKPRPESGKPKQRLQTVGLIIPDILNPFFPLLIKGIEQVSKIHNYSLILWDSENDATLEQQHLETLYDKGVDGIILVPSSGTSYSEELLQKGCPLVFLDRFIELDGTSAVLCDNEEGAYQAVKYLVKLGHWRIVMLTGPSDLSTERTRFEGMKRALAEEEIAFSDDLFVCGNYNLNEAYQAILRLVERRVEFTAIFATNDMMAFGAKKALEELGLQIPEDVSLIGYDDILFSSIIALTSVSQPTFEMGRNAMVLLLDLINERVTAPQQIVLRSSMVIRSSCQRR